MGKILLQSRAEAGVLTGFAHLSHMTANKLNHGGVSYPFLFVLAFPWKRHYQDFTKWLISWTTSPVMSEYRFFNTYQYWNIYNGFNTLFFAVYTDTTSCAFSLSSLRHEHCRVMRTFVNTVHQNYRCLATEIIRPKIAIKKLFQCSAE